MASGGWLGHTVSRAWHGVTGAVKKTVGAVTGGLLGGYRNSVASDTSQQVIATPSAAPAPTATEQAEYEASIQRQKKKRGKNSLFVSSSAGSSGGGSGINI